MFVKRFVAVGSAYLLLSAAAPAQHSVDDSIGIEGANMMRSRRHAQDHRKRAMSPISIDGADTADDSFIGNDIRALEAESYKDRILQNDIENWKGSNAASQTDKDVHSFDRSLSELSSASKYTAAQHITIAVSPVGKHISTSASVKAKTLQHLSKTTPPRDVIKNGLLEPDMNAFANAGLINDGLSELTKASLEAGMLDDSAHEVLNSPKFNPAQQNQEDLKKLTAKVRLSTQNVMKDDKAILKLDADDKQDDAAAQAQPAVASERNPNSTEKLESPATTKEGTDADASDHSQATDADASNHSQATDADASKHSQATEKPNAKVPNARNANANISTKANPTEKPNATVPRKERIASTATKTQKNKSGMDHDSDRAGFDRSFNNSVKDFKKLMVDVAAAARDIDRMSEHLNMSARHPLKSQDHHGILHLKVPVGPFANTDEDMPVDVGGITAQDGSFTRSLTAPALNGNDDKYIPVQDVAQQLASPEEEGVEAVAEGTGAFGHRGGLGSAQLDRIMRYRLEAQDIAVLCLLLLVYAFSLAIGLSLVHRLSKADEARSTIRFYAGGGRRLYCESQDEQVFLDTFNRAPLTPRLTIVGRQKTQSWLPWRRYQQAFNVALDLSSFVRPQSELSLLSHGSRQVLQGYLNSRTPLEELVLQKTVAWHGWEELATNVRARMRALGFDGVLEVKLKGMIEDVTVLHNESWTNFVNHTTTKMLVMLSIIGPFLYLPYVWIRRRRKHIKTKFELSISYEQYWELIESRLSASDGFEQLQ